MKDILPSVRLIRDILLEYLHRYLGPEAKYLTGARFSKVGVLQTTGMLELEAALLVRKEGPKPK